MLRKSKAAVFEGVPSQLVLKEIPTPSPQGKEVLVRVEACTLCGSDLHSIEGRRRVPVPTVLGHEIVGRIEAFGPGAPRADVNGEVLAEGSRVVWSIVASCGKCFYCQRQLPQKCLKSVKYGHEAFRPGYELLGGLAEHCLLAEGTAILRVPDALDVETICPASCATATIVAAMESFETLRHQVVCITGAGLLGLTAAAIARSRDAEGIIVVDPSEFRRHQACSFGATHVVAPDELPSVVREVTHGHGVDLALEVSGAPDAFRSLWPQLRLGATMVLVGAVFPADPVPLALEQIVRRNLTIRGIHNYSPIHLSAAIQFLHATRNFPFHKMVARWYPLNDVHEAVKDAQNPMNIRVGIRADS